MSAETYALHPIGFVRSELTDLDAAPRQGDEGAPDAWLEILPDFAKAVQGIVPGDDLLLLTWFHRADRGVLEVHPRGDLTRPLSGVFATRSPDRPNPIGLHRVTVMEVAEGKLRVGPLEAIDGTPVVDIKPVLSSDPSTR